MKGKFNLLIIFLITTFGCMEVYAQQPGVMFREGNSQYKEKKYDEAEINYRKGLEKQPDAVAGQYNLSNSLYMQEKYKEAAIYLDSLSKQTSNSKLLSDIYHNLGNAYLKDKEYEKSIEAYKEALRQQPKSEDSRYNLSYAYKKLKQQQQQQEQKKQQQQEKKEEKQENKEQQPQEQKKQGIQREEAERILDALERQEKDLRKEEEKKKGQGTFGGKDW